MLKYLFIVLVLVWPTKAYSHPHAWIDMETSIEFDQDGLVTGLRIGWFFDDLYSVYTLDGQEPTPKFLNNLAQETLNNLTEYHYFTRVFVNGVPIGIQEVKRYESQFIDGRWKLEFSVLLNQEIDLSQSKLSYRIFDPTYYVEILHKTNGQAVLLKGSSNCRYDLVSPNPPQDMVVMAAAIDRGQQAPKTLGEYFSEEVIVSCE